MRDLGKARLSPPKRLEAPVASSRGCEASRLNRPGDGASNLTTWTSRSQEMESPKGAKNCRDVPMGDQSLFRRIERMETLSAS
jgi:hypothetical protein